MDCALDKSKPLDQYELKRFSHYKHSRPVYTTLNFWHGTDKKGQPYQFYPCCFFRAAPKIEHSVNGPSVVKMPLIAKNSFNSIDFTIR